MINTAILELLDHKQMAELYTICKRTNIELAETGRELARLPKSPEEIDQLRSKARQEVLMKGWTLAKPYLFDYHLYKEVLKALR